MNKKRAKTSSQKFRKSNSRAALVSKVSFKDEPTTIVFDPNKPTNSKIL